MNAWGGVAGGFVGTLVLTTALRAAGELGLTRMDLPFLLGTIVSADRATGEGAGLCHALRRRPGLRDGLPRHLRRDRPHRLVAGSRVRARPRPFAGTALVNVLLPVIHARMGTPSSSAGDRPLLEPPGFMRLNYGRRTPLATIAAHIAFGTIVGGFISLAA